MKEIVLDTETTGLSVKDGHRIVEIGCIELDNLIPTKNIFHCYLNPEREVSKSALEVHGYTDKFLSDKRKFAEVADEFLKFINGKNIIIHNADFDIDTLEIARNKFPGSGISLDALCKRFKIDNSKRDKHTALIDCELLSKVYINLIGQKEPVFQFQNEVEKNNKELIKNIDYFKKVITPTLDEMENHKNFLKKELKKNFY